jgi:hypothetical protein
LRVDVAEFGESTQSAISTLTWSRLGDVVYVAIDCVILTVGFKGDDSKCGVARRAIAESKNLPSYHPRVLIDWLKRGEVDRTRKSLRRRARRGDVLVRSGLRSKRNDGDIAVDGSRPTSRPW